ncbi:MAG TPA: DEAD/DEAH box helicase, partial [Pedococcus sp.]|nr:DEAD/DEAH box helicase [Pedococcus sp.]
MSSAGSEQPRAARNRRRRPRRGPSEGAAGQGQQLRQPRQPRQPRHPRPRRAIPVPELRYPEQLPVVARKDDIAAAIRDHQVVVIAGETGSGKTTQLPKMCLELGRGRPGETGQIAHTQPRRIAARSVAERIAEELEVELGGAIGYQVRFTDTSSDDTLVKVMTDGILLNEMQRDRMLRKYDTIIIDEAH